MKRSAEVYLTQNGNTYRLYADVIEQSCLQIVNEAPINFIKYEIIPLLHFDQKIVLVGPFRFDILESFSEILICYSTYNVELFKCNLIQKHNSGLGPSCFFELNYDRSNIVGMWHALDWKI